MPFARIAGYVRLRRVRHPGRPDQGLPGEEGGDQTPDWGLEEGAGPGQGLPDEELPGPPPGIWPPLTPEQPWRPIPSWPERPAHGLPPSRPGAPGAPGQGLPGAEAPDQGLPGEDLPPGSIWPPLPPGVHGHFLALVLIGGGGHGAHYRYVVVDADARPPAGGVGGRPPERPTPQR